MNTMYVHSSLAFFQCQCPGTALFLPYIPMLATQLETPPKHTVTTGHQQQFLCFQCQITESMSYNEHRKQK